MITPKQKKTTGLGAFAAKTQPAVQPTTNDAITSIQHDVNQAKPKAEKLVACTVRMPHAAWLKIQHLILDQGTSFQALSMLALENELKRRGLPGFD